MIAIILVHTLGIFSALKGSTALLIVYALVLIACLIYNVLRQVTMDHLVNPVLSILSAGLALLYANINKQETEKNDKPPAATA